MIQTIETRLGTTVITDTNHEPPRVIIEHRGGRVVVEATDDEAVFAIRSSLSRAVDAFKASAHTPTTPKGE